MKTYLECIPCFFKQALFAARAATGDEAAVKRALDGVAALLPEIPLDQPPPETARRVYAEVREATGKPDPFKAHKEESIQRTLALYGEMKSEVEAAEDPLRAAVRIAIAGNVIDLGADPDFDLEAELKEVRLKAPAVDDYASFRECVRRARTVLYLGDNAGETVFDRLLIETMRKEAVYYAVRDVPIINDATVEDAERSGIGHSARIISSGCDAPGTILRRCSREFLDVFESADLIVSKGQGNLETLSDVDAPIFYLLKTKCPVIARHLGTNEGDMVLKDARKRIKQK
jgi:damage-control phosphatase, subfamily I